MKIIAVLLAVFLGVSLVVISNVSADSAEVALMANVDVVADCFDGNYGNELSISGNYAIIGADGVAGLGADGSDFINDTIHNYFGAAYIYHYDEAGWLEQRKLTAINGTVSDNFGSAVSISGNTAIVGACYGDGNTVESGVAYIYQYDGAGWVEQQKLAASDGAMYDHFGQYVSISGDFAIVGAYAARNGVAYIYHYDGSSWVEQQKLTASDGAASDAFGDVVSISGDYAIVGAQLNDDNGSDSGSAYIYNYNGSRWVEQQKLLASDGVASDRFGSAVSISGDFAIVGAYLGDGNVADTGAAYIFHYDGINWVEQQKLLLSAGGPGDGFGSSVAIAGDNAIVGGAMGINKGAAYIYRYDGRSWVEVQRLGSSNAASIISSVAQCRSLQQ